MKNKKNLTCCIYKEYIDLLEHLPESERYEIFYKSIKFAFNQEYSINVSDSMSNIGKSVFNLLKTIIVCKKVSLN